MLGKGFKNTKQSIRPPTLMLIAMKLKYVDVLVRYITFWKISVLRVPKIYHISKQTESLTTVSVLLP